MATASAVTEPSAASGKKPFLDLRAREWLWPVIFMLGMSMVGLCFPLGYLVVLASLLYALINDRYNLVIMLTIYSGGYSLATTGETYFSRSLAFAVCLVILLILRKDGIVKRVSLLFLAYMLCMCWFAWHGVVGFAAQFGMMAAQLSIIWFVVPLIAFSGREFDMAVFFRRTYPFVIIGCIYYFLDGFVMGGQVFMPRDPMLSQTFAPRFYNLQLSPFSFEFGRRWPWALFLMPLSLLPTLKYYRLRPWVWFFVIFALYISRTFSILVGLLVSALCIVDNRKKIIRGILIAFGVLTALYFIDDALGPPAENGSTTLRIKSQIDQLTGFAALNGDEDALAELGTGRGAQILPALELFDDYNKYWTGFGFLDKETTPHQYFYDSEFIEDEDAAERLVSDIESEPFVVLMQTGIAGLIIHYGFYVALWFMVRRLRYSKYFLSLLIFFFINGLTAFSGLYRIEGLYLCGLALGVVLLANYDRNLHFSDAEFGTSRDDAGTPAANLSDGPR